MIERGRNGSRGNPDREARAWAEKLVEADRMRVGYQELAAKGLMTLEELGARLKELENTRRSATHELDAIRRGASASKSWSVTGTPSWSPTPGRCRKLWRTSSRRSATESTRCCG